MPSPPCRSGSGSSATSCGSWSDREGRPEKDEREDRQLAALLFPFLPGQPRSLKHLALDQLRHHPRPEMEGEAEAVKVQHALDLASRVYVRVQQFLLLRRHGGGEPVQPFLSDPRRRGKGRVLAVAFSRGRS